MRFQSKRFVPLSTIALLAFAILTAPVLAQSTGTIQGTVTDPSGAVVPNAQVTAINTGTNTTRVTQSDASGNYLLPAMPIGTYRIEVQASGMARQVVNGLVLEV